ncbi:MAG: hypothetical protein K2I10_12570 [Lachnospiraceae bacterium]|nr:hypothetical protein [Lachnospiraceae bacterium]
MARCFAGINCGLEMMSPTGAKVDDLQKHLRISLYNVTKDNQTSVMCY